jgi:hypothetical protein
MTIKIHIKQKITMLLVHVSNHLHIFFHLINFSHLSFYANLVTSFFLFLLGFPFLHFQGSVITQPTICFLRDVFSSYQVFLELGNPTNSVDLCVRYIAKRTQLPCTLRVLLSCLPPLRAITFLRHRF